MTDKQILYVESKIDKHSEIKNNWNKFKIYFQNKTIPDTNSDSEKLKVLKNIFNKIKSTTYLKKLNKSFMGNIIAWEPNTYQMDIFFLGRKNLFLLAVNVNTKFAWIRKLESKSGMSVLKLLPNLIKDLNPNVLECDEEAAFKDYRVLNYLYDKGVKQKFVIQALHSDLSPINRLSRTLHEMGATPENIVKKVKTYNNTWHSTIRCKPNQMDKKLEELYVFKKLEANDEKAKLFLNEKLGKGSKVRYVRDDQKLFEKGRHKFELSKYYYIVEEVYSPYRYLIVAEDGTAKIVPRFRLVKVKEDEQLKYAPTIEDPTHNPVYKNIKQTWHTRGKQRRVYYVVEQVFRDANGKRIKKDITIDATDLRNPREPPTDIEINFLNSHPNYELIDGMILPKQK